MSYTAAAFQAMVATLLNRADQTSNIATFCALAVQELENTDFWFLLTSGTVSTANAVKYAALPTGFIREVKDGVLNTSGMPLAKETWAEIDNRQRTGGVGEPASYAIADKFYFYPIPNAVYALPLLYYKSLGFPSSTANAWTDTVWDLTLWETLRQAWLYLKNPQEVAACEIEVSRRMAKYKSRSGKLTGRGTVRYKEF
jgi:hypothetical protein